jgi:hypothetical protein
MRPYLKKQPFTKKGLVEWLKFKLQYCKKKKRERERNSNGGRQNS